MADIEIVKVGLKYHRDSHKEGCVQGSQACPYIAKGDRCFHILLDDALSVINEQQERIKVLEDEAKTKGTPQKVLNRKELADLIVGECPLCGALFNNEICPASCGWCGCLLDWKDGEQE